MFERTFSFWRRLIRGEPTAVNGAAGARGVAGDERRLWVRYPADFDTNVQVNERVRPIKSPAKIRDLSCGGANLLLDHEVQPGQLIHLEMPHPTDGECMVLACVVRAEREPTGKWALGCVFARELSEDDLHELGARRVRHAPEDKRLWKRFPTTVQVCFRQVGATDGPPNHAEVLNLSATGVGLLVDDFFETGALLHLDLSGQDSTESRTILSCVVHVSERDDGRWALGCNFIRELSDTDLRALV
jgi:hypothetical protein